jgi:hypothetical protein
MVTDHLGRAERSRQLGSSGEVDLGFGFDDEEGVGVGVAGGTEFLAGFVEGVGEDGEDDATVVAADEMEAEFVLDELELGRHVRVGALSGHPRKDDPTGSIHGIEWRIN